MWYKFLIIRNNLLGKIISAAGKKTEELYDENIELTRYAPFGTVKPEEEAKPVSQIQEEKEQSPWLARPSSGISVHQTMDIDTPAIEVPVPRDLSDADIKMAEMMKSLLMQNVKEDEIDNIAGLYDTFSDICDRILMNIKNTQQKIIFENAKQLLLSEINRHGFNFESYSLAAVQIPTDAISEKSKVAVERNRDVIKQELEKQIQIAVNLKRQLEFSMDRTKQKQTDFRGRDLNLETIEELEKDPSIQNDELKFELLQEIKKELGKIPAERQEIYDSFRQVYLQKDFADEKQKEETFGLLFGYKYRDSKGVIKDVPKSRLTETGEVEPDKFLKENIFVSKGGVEIYLTFFAPSNPYFKWTEAFRNKFINFIVAKKGDQFRADELNALNQFIKEQTEGRKSGISRVVGNYLQNSDRVSFFMSEIANIINGQSLDGDNRYGIDYKTLQKRFFDWVVEKVSAASRREAEKLTGQSASEEVDVVEQALEGGEKGSGFKKDKAINRQAVEKIDDRTINSCAEIPKIDQNASVNTIRYAINCLRDDWQKLNFYIESVVNKMQQLSNNLSGSNVQEDYVTNLLRKTFLWDRMRRSTDRVVKNLVQRESTISEDFVQTVTAANYYHLLNRNWRSIFRLEWIAAENIKLNESMESASTYDYEFEDEASVVDSNQTANVTQMKAATMQVREMCQKFVNLGFAKSLDDAYIKLMGKNAKDYVYMPLVNGKKQEPTAAAAKINRNARFILRENAYTNIAEFKDILLDSQIINDPIMQGKGMQIALTFISLIGYDVTNARLGLIFSRKNLSSFDDKINLLADYLSRGVDITGEVTTNLEKNFEQEKVVITQRLRSEGYDEDQIEKYLKIEFSKYIANALKNFSPQQINSIFDTIREVMPIVYGADTYAKDYLEANIGKGFIDAKLINTCLQQAANDPENADISDFLLTLKIENAADFAKFKGLRKTNNAALKAIARKFQDNMKKDYYLESAAQYEYLLELLTADIKRNLLKENWVQQFRFRTVEDFLQKIHPDLTVDSSPQLFKAKLSSLPRFYLLKICEIFSPKIFMAYKNNTLGKSQLTERHYDPKFPDMHTLYQLLGSQITKMEKFNKTRTALIDIQTAQLFAEILDALPSEKYAKCYFTLKVAGYNAITDDNKLKQNNKYFTIYARRKDRCKCRG
jgi:hypothetical protein